MATAQSQVTSGTHCWGNSFAYDIWANLLSKTVTKCTAETLTVAVNTSNRITNTGFAYDAAGNLTNSGSGVMTYDAENRLTAIAGVTYTYDGDGKRVKKSSGKLYWTGTGSDALAETDLAGTILSEFTFFGGKRIARRDGSGNTVFYYFSDHLGSASVVTNATGTNVEESDYYPFGGERIITNSDPNQYKFTGKERDAESGLDYFGARHFASTMGRFMSSDPLLNSGRPWQPQTWNRYAYTLNNPLKFLDPNGLYEWAANTCGSNDNQCNKEAEKNQQKFRDGLKNLEKARDAFKAGSKEYNRLDGALKAYGKEGDGNNVSVAFGATTGGEPAEVTPTNNNTAYTVTFDTKMMGGNSQIWAINVGHEGTHVSDFQMPLTDLMKQSPFSIEYRGYETSSFTAQGLGAGELSVKGNVIWNSSWKAVDVQTLRDKGITDHVKTKHSETQPHNPLPN